MEQRYFSLREVAQITGIKRSYLHKLTGSRLVAFCRPFGQKIYMTKDQIEEMMERRTAKAASQIKEDTIELLQTKIQRHAH